MTEGTIQQVFYTVEMKLNSYLTLVEKGVGYSKEYRSWLHRSPDFEYIERAVPLLGKQQSKEHIGILIKKLESILNDDEKVNILANIVYKDSDFCTLDDCVSEIKDALIEIRTRLEHMLRYNLTHAVSDDSPVDTLEPRLGDKRFIFSTSIYKDLARYMIDDENVFDYEFEEDESFRVLISNIQAFLMGNFEAINGMLNFNIEQKQVAYFLINSLTEHSKFNLADIRNVTINGEQFKAENCSVAISKQKKARQLGSLSQIISMNIAAVEDLLLKHLKLSQ